MDLNNLNSPAGAGTLARLRQFSKPAAVQAERCELCAAPLAAEHEHLLEPAKRSLVCACQACAVLFSSSDSLRYRRVPRRIEQLTDFQLTDLQWGGLGIPIALAFIFYNSTLQQMMTVYPSPAGATESSLATEGWLPLVEENPVLKLLQPDVEALLINRIASAREYYRVPIDECFKLVGIIKLNWRGLSGGTKMWQCLLDFFASLKARGVARSARA